MALKVLALCPKVKLCVTKHSEPLDRIIRCILESDEEGMGLKWLPILMSMTISI